MTTQHTPGPWRVTRQGYILAIRAGEIIEPLAYFPDDQQFDAERTKANAALMAQAPDLLAQRDALLAALQKIASGEGYYGAQAAEYKAIARAAIAQATGEQS